MGWFQLPNCLRFGRKEFTLSTEKIVDSQDENTERGNWSSKTDYLLSMVGYAVGLGNVWRFPYLTYENGGGAFLIPYAIMLALAGLPLFFMECSLGQFASLGPVSIWRILPLFQGVGITMVVISTFVTIYYNVIIAYSLYYLFASFQRVVPWDNCNATWADHRCSKTPLVLSCNVTMGDIIVNMSYPEVLSKNLTCIPDSQVFEDSQLPSEQYWNYEVLQRSANISETGVIVWYLALCLLLSWLIVAVSLVKGIKSSGKVVYFTALFPYVVLIILLVRGVTLVGARDGIEFYIGAQSDFKKLLNAEVWKAAATQIFFSLSVAWGGLVALSSYNKFRNNCYADAIFVCLTNCLTSVFAGFAIFSILGHMAYMSKKKVEDVVKSGFDLAFVAYPEALSQLPVAPLWSFLFFFMLLLLGLDSQFATIETITTTIQDIYPAVMKKMRVFVTMGLCMLLFFLGLVCVTQAGIYWVNLVDHFCAGWGILFAAILELVGICWIYGGNRFIQDIEMMIGKKSFLFWLWWRACWFFITPCLLLAILIWSLIDFKPPEYAKEKYPLWGTAMGWCLITFCLIWIPAVAIYKIIKAKGNLWQRFVSCLKPKPNWGPALECHRGERYKDMVDPVKKQDVEIPTVDSYVHKLE
ncbi:sodium- and chloride-dependent neutral and basic amino acid transporter B(0+) [Thamnophis elegans]|uniref:sodium- and chloride-dependent neutral and basic amino acid transporter B(0+) n=1 Tax=Thamnophis elegans TaxID=35005 RepID=UPI001377D9EA|nr:sodium- and chloride-dependent neutral and basic amino acid transporter B(0+) [Thamnophis elegans]